MKLLPPSIGWGNVSFASKWHRNSPLRFIRGSVTAFRRSFSGTGHITRHCSNRPVAPRDPSYPRRPREQCSRLLNYSLWLLAFVSVRSTRPLLHLISPSLSLSLSFIPAVKRVSPILRVQSSWNIYIFFFPLHWDCNNLRTFSIWKKETFYQISFFSLSSYIRDTGYYFYVLQILSFPLYIRNAVFRKNILFISIFKNKEKLEHDRPGRCRLEGQRKGSRMDRDGTRASINTAKWTGTSVARDSTYVSFFSPPLRVYHVQTLSFATSCFWYFGTSFDVVAERTNFAAGCFWSRSTRFFANGGISLSGVLPTR